MKQTAATAVLSILFLTSSCGLASNKKAKSIKEEEAAIKAYISTIDSTTAAIQSAQSVEDFTRITNQFAELANQFAEKHKESEAPKELLDQTTAAAIKYQEAVVAKVHELSVKEADNYSYIDGKK